MVSFDKSDSFDDESENDGSDSGSAGTCNFPFCFDEFVGRVGDSVVHVEKYVGRVNSMGSGVFALIGIESIDEVVPLVLFVSKVFESKVS